MDKKLTTVAMMVFAVMFVSILSIITISVVNKGKDSANDLGMKFYSMDTSNPMYYDNRTISGAEVVSLLGQQRTDGVAILVEGKKFIGSSGYAALACSGFSGDFNEADDCVNKIVPVSNTKCSIVSSTTYMWVPNKKSGVIQYGNDIHDTREIASKNSFIGMCFADETNKGKVSVIVFYEK